MSRATTYGAIPTVYRGVQMRSRLEARYAALFDILGIRWEYEPVDLRGYVPDFVVQLLVPVLLECKPAVTLADFRAPQARITRSGWAGPAVVVGSSLQLAADDRPDLTARGTAEVGASPWRPVGRLSWPAPWGPCPFADDLLGAWREAGNAAMWRRPT